MLLFIFRLAEGRRLSWSEHYSSSATTERTWNCRHLWIRSPSISI